MPKDYNGHANNFSICQNKEGKIFEANANGILVFDGFNWQLNISQDEYAVNAVFKSSDNKIYYSVEGINDFGLFEQSKNGKYVYISLLGNLKENERPTEPVKQIFEHNKAIYFLSSDKLIEYKNNSLEPIRQLIASIFDL